MQLIEKTGERNWEAEIIRQKGELLLKQAKPDKSEIESCFRRALEIATTQNAKSLALRSAMSLARILQGQKSCGDARNALKQIYGWFTVGFATADLKEAKTLL